MGSGVLGGGGLIKTDYGFSNLGQPRLVRKPRSGLKRIRIRHGLQLGSSTLHGDHLRGITRRQITGGITYFNKADGETPEWHNEQADYHASMVKGYRSGRIPVPMSDKMTPMMLANKKTELANKHLKLSFYHRGMAEKMLGTMVKSDLGKFAEWMDDPLEKANKINKASPDYLRATGRGALEGIAGTAIGGYAGLKLGRTFIAPVIAGGIAGGIGRVHGEYASFKNQAKRAGYDGPSNGRALAIHSLRGGYEGKFIGPKIKQKMTKSVGEVIADALEKKQYAHSSDKGGHVSDDGIVMHHGTGIQVKRGKKFQNLWLRQHFNQSKTVIHDEGKATQATHNKKIKDMSRGELAKVLGDSGMGPPVGGQNGSLDLFDHALGTVGGNNPQPVAHVNPGNHFASGWHFPNGNPPAAPVASL